MSCILTNGIPIQCLNSTGGIKNVLIGNYSEDTVFTFDVDNVIETVTSTETFYKFKFRPQTSSYTEEATISVENGSNFFSQNVAMVFHQMDATKRNTILMLVQASTHVIVEDQNGKRWWIGLANGANATAATIGAGQAYGDLNGYNITITGQEPLAAYELSEAAFAALTVAP